VPLGTEGIFPLRRGRELSIGIPASLVSDVPHLREKTFRIGLIGRAAAIFRVDEIIIFPDIPQANQSRDIDLIAIILSYMETPQYLRKHLFKIRPELGYAGVLPPLRTPHHPLSDRMENLKVGEYREGVVVSSSKGGSFVDIGVEHPIMIPHAYPTRNTRVTVRISELGTSPIASLRNREEIKLYWGCRVTVSPVPFGQFVKSRSFDMAIATSRYGVPISSIMDELAEHWTVSRRRFIVFGAPTQGLHQIVSHEHLKLDDLVHYTVNAIPNQGTQTVRTEEAVYASLALLNQFADSRR